MTDGTGIQNDSRRGEDISPSDVCRNFLRGSCQRGMACVYRHLQPGEVVSLISSGHDLCRTTFCRDFQKLSCRRPNCKLIHASQDEEEHFRRTGRLPTRLDQLEAFGGTLSGSQGYMQSMYTSALAQTGFIGMAKKRPAEFEEHGDREMEHLLRDSQPRQKERDEFKLRIGELELEVKALQSMNKSLLQENFKLRGQLGIE